MTGPYTAIFAAAAFEYNEVKKAVSYTAQVKITDTSCISGKLGERKILLIKTGMGLQNAQKAFAGICRKDFKINSIINIGTGGALNPDYAAGDVVLADRAVKESDGTEYVPELIDIKPYTCGSVKVHLKSKLISVNKPVCSPARRHYYRSVYNADVADMEAAGLIEMAVGRGIPCCVIKGISDTGDDLTNIAENIIRPDGRLNCREMIFQIARSPYGSVKSFVHMYKNCLSAMNNAVSYLGRVI